MPRRNANVRMTRPKRVKHRPASPSTRRKRARTRTYIADPHDPSRTVVAWKKRAA